ncbi:hypothetical protein [Streptomyces sp. NPDC059979]|uniref:hypothetical protein n=1 Tax=unclassified Streptomyces TaxID=2593676 RepID=UPI00366637F9
MSTSGDHALSDEVPKRPLHPADPAVMDRFPGDPAVMEAELAATLERVDYTDLRDVSEIIAACRGRVLARCDPGFEDALAEGIALVHSLKEEKTRRAIRGTRSPWRPPAPLPRVSPNWGTRSRPR